MGGAVAWGGCVTRRVSLAERRSRDARQSAHCRRNHATMGAPGRPLGFNQKLRSLPPHPSRLPTAGGEAAAAASAAIAVASFPC